MERGLLRNGKKATEKWKEGLREKKAIVKWNEGQRERERGLERGEKILI